jgi:hypothetical protein
VAGPYDPEDRQVEPPALVRHDAGVPPRRAVRRVLVGRLDHDLGDQGVRVGPVLGERVVPRGTREVTQSGDQALPDLRIMQRLDAEFPVVGAELANERNEILQVVDLGDYSSKRAQQAVTLMTHSDREHVPQLRISQEQIRVKEQCHSVTVLGDLCEVVLQALSVHTFS